MALCIWSKTYWAEGLGFRAGYLDIVVAARNWDEAPGLVFLVKGMAAGADMALGYAEVGRLAESGFTSTQERVLEDVSFGVSTAWFTSSTLDARA